MATEPTLRRAWVCIGCFSLEVPEGTSFGDTLVTAGRTVKVVHGPNRADDTGKWIALVVEVKK